MTNSHVLLVIQDGVDLGEIFQYLSIFQLIFKQLVREYNKNTRPCHGVSQIHHLDAPYGRGV